MEDKLTQALNKDIHNLIEEQVNKEINQKVEEFKNQLLHNKEIYVNEIVKHIEITAQDNFNNGNFNKTYIINIINK